MDTYTQHLRKRTNTPANESVPGREGEMTSLSSGAVVFREDDFTHLRKCLIMGTASNTYYDSKWELTKEFENVVATCSKLDPVKTADLIAEVSDKGLALRVDSCLFALVVLSLHAPTEFYRVATKVVRTLSHLHSFVDYCKPYRGTGGVIGKFGKRWFAEKDTKYLTYQFLKFNQRKGFTFRDQLRIFKPNPGDDESKNRLFSYATGKSERYGDSVLDLVQGYPSLEQIGWLEWLKTDPTPENTIKAVSVGKLTHEMVAPLGGMNGKVWAELFKTMPIHALIRNLGNLSSHGVFDDKNNLLLLSTKLENKEALRKARVHPYQLLLANRVYAQGGRSYSTKSNKTWTVNQFVNNILDSSLELSFSTQEPTNQTFFFGIDVSGSMTSRFGQDRLICCSEVAALMALVQARKEKFNYIYGFNRTLVDLGISSRDTFNTACQKVCSRTFGSTNAGSVYQYAIKRKLNVDTFCFYTDAESYGGQQSFQLLNEYRKRVNPNARAVYVTLTPRNGSLADPKDAGSLSIGGFDPQAPSIISSFSLGLI